jgi:hypothetical protein
MANFANPVSGRVDFSAGRSGFFPYRSLHASSPHDGERRSAGEITGGVVLLQWIACNIAMHRPNFSFPNGRLSCAA